MLFEVIVSTYQVVLMVLRQFFYLAIGYLVSGFSGNNIMWELPLPPEIYLFQTSSLFLDSKEEVSSYQASLLHLYCVYSPSYISNQA